ncbi:hypothetical protein KUCAC02_016369 [Chaenocephalus aceratus]|uniref:Uncharacterized protein n=1 Tax=Chaenocephalus aceratus TaxID=36190 RepID=A0ACB9Y2C0_CHAAC|nr:hypothetical protein KUCAC02_016369 [Chaenocephalus aceratus]
MLTSFTTEGRLSSYLTSRIWITEVAVRGEEAFRPAQRPVRSPNKAAVFRPTLTLSFIIYRGSVPRCAALRENNDAHCQLDNGQ